jgi:hypothetical protein
MASVVGFANEPAPTKVKSVKVNHAYRFPIIDENKEIPASADGSMDMTQLPASVLGNCRYNYAWR